MYWIPYELHCHTFHSDGKQTLAELAEGASRLGFAGVALTDHNTMTGLIGKERIETDTGVHIVPGLEWTTFFGHMVTLGLQRYVDWRDLSPFHLHRGIHEVHAQGGVVGLGHPFRVGSPMCTGCYWEFDIDDWNKIDYIEVWSGLFPSILQSNQRAFELWTDKLNDGYRIAATSGRDWHTADPTSEPTAATFLRIDHTVPATEGVVRAIREGRTSVSMGPVPVLQARNESGGEWMLIGDTVETAGASDVVEIQIALDYAARNKGWSLPEQTLEIRLTGNCGVVSAANLLRGETKRAFRIPVRGLRWLRAEVYGVLRQTRTMIGFTSPIYFSYK